VRSHIERHVAVVGWADRSELTLLTEEIDHLTANNAPAFG
jgi:hypothetical protein